MRGPGKARPICGAGSIREVEFRPKVNETLVEMLEYALKDAKAGVLVSGTFAGSTVSGEVRSHFSSTSNRLLEIAALGRLLHRLHLSCDEEAAKTP